MLRFVFICLVLPIKDFVVTQTLPRNAAARVGDEVVFNCSSSGQSPLWQYSSNGFNLFVYISAAGNCKLLNSSLTNYKVESTTALGCNLIVIKANTSDAGVYICDDTQGQKILAMLNVIDKIQVFPTNEELGPVVENELINMTCSVQHTAPSIPAPQMFPSIVWTNLSANANITGDESSTSSLVTSNITVIAIRPTVPSYSCIVYFKEPNPTVDYAMNAPYYTNTTMTQILLVQYNGPSNVTVTSYYESDICEAKILDCLPNSYPPAVSIYWSDVIRNEIIHGSNITGEYGGEYICTVTNTINGFTHQSITAYSLHDFSAFTLPPCQGVNSSKVEVSVLGKDCNFEYDAYACKNVTEVTITCNIVDALPTATVFWEGPCITSSDNQHPWTIIAQESGSYNCTVKNSFNERLYEASATLKITGLLDDPSKCTFASSCPQSIESDSTASIILGVFLGVSLLVNLAFIIWIFTSLLPKAAAARECTDGARNGTSTEYHDISMADIQTTPSPYETLQKQQDAAAPYEHLSPPKSS